MLKRRPIFPNVIELNVQAGRLIGCNVYLVFDENQWILLDIGYDDTVDEIIELIRQLDFPLSQCQAMIATHADVDHIQGMARAKQVLRTQVMAHGVAAQLMESGDRVRTFAHIESQNVDLPLPTVKIDRRLDEGDVIRVGNLEIQVWSAPGHAEGHLALRLGELLFCGDTIYRDGCVGAIDAHHGSDLEAFIATLKRIEQSDVSWLLPSHGPYFRKDDQLIRKTIQRLEGYRHMADFGTCAVDWPLLDQWEQEIADGDLPT